MTSSSETVVVVDDVEVDVEVVGAEVVDVLDDEVGTAVVSTKAVDVVTIDVA